MPRLNSGTFFSYLFDKRCFLLPQPKSEVSFCWKQAPVLSTSSHFLVTEIIFRCHNLSSELYFSSFDPKLFFGAMTQVLNCISHFFYQKAFLLVPWLKFQTSFLLLVLEKLFVARTQVPIFFLPFFVEKSCHTKVLNLTSFLL